MELQLPLRAPSVLISRSRPSSWIPGFRSRPRSHEVRAGSAAESAREQPVPKTAGSGLVYRLVSARSGRGCMQPLLGTRRWHVVRRGRRECSRGSSASRSDGCRCVSTLRSWSGRASVSPGPIAASPSAQRGRSCSRASRGRSSAAAAAALRLSEAGRNQAGTLGGYEAHHRLFGLEPHGHNCAGKWKKETVKSA